MIRSVKSVASTLNENLTDSATVLSSVESSAVPVYDLEKYYKTFLFKK